MSLALGLAGVSEGGGGGGASTGIASSWAMVSLSKGSAGCSTGLGIGGRRSEACNAGRGGATGRRLMSSGRSRLPWKASESAKAIIRRDGMSAVLCNKIRYSILSGVLMLEEVFDAVDDFWR